ncbi:hypothetical protein E2C01_072493 [Portunus trituberculatus]|uniref:Uncharacterized protein n=1 Tax=Portunus trituberculatus TaxID=210409 RepID=A0A5B7I007_PORTR|nr:hypothetical protein [Portunus trituberculatus]
MACLPTQRRGRNVEESSAVNNPGATYSRDSHSISGRHLGTGKEAGKAESRRRDEAALRSPHFLSFPPLPHPTHPKVPHPKQFSCERNCSAERTASSDTV